MKSTFQNIIPIFCRLQEVENKFTLAGSSKDKHNHSNSSLHFKMLKINTHLGLYGVFYYFVYI